MNIPTACGSAGMWCSFGHVFLAVLAITTLFLPFLGVLADLAVLAVTQF